VDVVAESVELLAPAQVSLGNVGGAHDEDVDVAASVAVASSCRAEHRDVCRGDCPLGDLGAHAAFELGAHVRDSTG